MTVHVLDSGARTTGDTLVADFGAPGVLEEQFTLTNFSYTTDSNDGGRECITPTDGATLATMIAASEFQFRDSETRLRVWVPGSAHPSNLLRAHARYVNANNSHWATKNFDTGGTSIERRIAGSTSSVGTFAQADVGSGYWQCAFKALGATHLSKWWREGNPEPAWQIIRSVEPSAGNWMQIGVPALSVQLMGATLITDFQVTEILR